MRIFYKLPDLRTIKNFCFNFLQTHPWECTAKISKACFLSIQRLDELLHKTKFYMQWKENDIFCGNLGLVNHVFVTHNRLFSQRSFFSCQVITYCSAIAHTEKTQIFFITALLAKKKVYHF